MTDLILTGGTVAVDNLPGFDAGWLNPGAILVQDGRIRAFTPGSSHAELSDLSPEAQIIPVHGLAVIPALVNAHTHLSQTFMRGLAGGRPLLRWLKELIWPLQNAMSVEILELAALLGLAENTRCGAASLVDHQKITASPVYTQAVARAAQRSGLRVTVARAWSDRGAGAEQPQAILEELHECFESTQPGERVRFASGPLTTWRCSAETLQAAHHLAKQYNTLTHIHVSETADEVQISLKETGLRPVAWLDSLGILDQHCQVVHAVWVDPAEIAILAERQPLVVHCPVSNAVLGSGIAPLKAMLASGLRLSLGSDGPASNDTQDCFETMKMAVCLGRAVSLDAAFLPPRQALELATGRAGLAVGQAADLALVRLDALWSAPVQDFDSAIVLCSRAADVQALMVGGEFVMLDSKLTKLDEEIILEEARQAIKSLRRKAGLDQ